MIRTIAIAAALLLTLASTGGAVDDEGRFFVRAAGAYSCERWTTASAEEKIYAEHWWAGYMTAANRFTPDTYDILGSTSVDTMNGMLLRLCAAEPTQLFAIAVHKAMEQLHAQRTRKSPGR